MNDISTIVNAANLGGEEKALLETLVGVYASNLQRNKERMDYYRGRTKVKNLGIAVPDKLEKLELSCCWPQKTVEALQSRSIFDGFVTNDAEVDARLMGIAANNDLRARYSRAVIPELVHGCAFATVGRTKDGKATIRFRTAETAAAIWDGEKDRIKAGFAIVDSKRFNADTAYQPCLVNLYTDDAIWVIRRDSLSSGWVAEKLPHQMGRPTMEPFVYRPSEDKPFGKSRITRPVMALTDSYLREMLRLEVAAEMFTSPQKAILGAGEEAFDMDKYNAYITNFLVVGKDEDGDVPTLMQLNAASMQPHIDVMRNLAAQFAGATCVPISELGVIHDNPSSAEAIYAAKEALVIEVDSSLNKSNGESLKNVALMAQAIERNMPLDKLTDAERAISVKFKNPAMPSIVSQADAMTKIAGAAPWIAETETFLAEIGFDEATRRTLMTDKTKAANTAAVNAIFGGEVTGDADTA